MHVVDLAQADRKQWCHKAVAGSWVSPTCSSEQAIRKVTVLAAQLKGLGPNYHCQYALAVTGVRGKGG